ncbi:conserved hypothetical protein [uncultured Stenotrophomonas sp.]|uniref:Uncharacterized protein n=1 Tax=uncultured Stenotrophomonas sp. TaxID=165438 RepID=A0A1Y5Q5X6_9GAMM|nr:conserved hypothetical protein [uncultured Stenotrophomonas sp.]
MSEILVPVSFGELLDKITILQIKSERIGDAAKLANVRKELAALEADDPHLPARPVRGPGWPARRHELAALEATWSAHPAAAVDIAVLHAELKAVNEQLWDIEDDIRLKDKAQAFDDGFVELARSVYFRNDERARIKKAINLALGSGYVEEKSYADYGTR